MNDYAVDRSRWAELGILEQMDNIASEVGRAISAQRRNKPERAQRATDRALDLFDATIEVQIRQNPPRAREVLRAREEFLRLFYDGTFDEDAQNIERYFNQFAMAARRKGERH